MGTYHYAPVHAYVQCETCGWETGSYKNAQALAKIHAKKYGHKVSGDLGISFGYDYSMDKPTLKSKELRTLKE